MAADPSAGGSASTLSEETLSRLLSVLSMTKSPLEKASAAFDEAFPQEERFVAGCGACMMLQDNLLPRGDRIVAFFVLSELYRNDPDGTNPFLPFFLDALEHKSVDVCEQQFLIHLLCSPPSNRDAASKTAQDVIAEFGTKTANIPDLGALRAHYAESTPAIRMPS